MVSTPIVLTEPQQKELDAVVDDPRVIDPRSRKQYHLLSDDEYEIIRSVLEEERQEAAIRAYGRRTAILREEDDP